MKVVDFFTETLHLSDNNLISELVKKSSIKTIKKGEYLIRQGQRAEHIFFLVDGICRGFFVDINGKDITDCLIYKCGAPIIASSDFSVSAPIAIETLTKSTVVCITVFDFNELLDRFSEANILYRNLLQNSNDLHRSLKIMAYQFTAMQRYHWFLKNYPGVIDKISHKYVASYLNMSPVTLSRLINMSDSITDNVELFC